MSTDVRCEETRALLAEVALGVADGEERARVLDHVADCADCRAELARQSVVADDLLALAPGLEPPLGFELGVRRAIEPPSIRRRRRLLRPLVAVAALAVVVAITAGAMLAAFSDDRRLADHYRATLDQAHGTYFGAVRLEDVAGRPGGVVFTYRGNPSWLLVTVAPPLRKAVTGAELVERDGRRVPLGSFRLVDGTWGGSLPAELGTLAAIHLVDAGGRPVLVARL
jgi:putative zinc finger protein